MDSQPHYSVLILVSETTHAIPLDFPSWPSSTSTNATSPTVDRNRNGIRLQIHFNINIFNSHVHPDKISYFILLILSSSLYLLCNCEQQKAAVKWFTTKTSTAQHRGPTNLYSLKMNSLLVQQVTAYIIIQHNSLFHNRLFVTSLVSRIIAQVLRAARWLKVTTAFSHWSKLVWLCSSSTWTQCTAVNFPNKCQVLIYTWTSEQG